MTDAVDVDSLAADRNVLIARNHASGNDAAGFALRQGSLLIVGVNTATSPRRQRWAVARGLGHLELHQRTLIVWHDVQIDDRQESVATTVEEREANRYAADLLLPEVPLTAVLAEEVGAGYASRDAVIQAVARRFQVSDEAAGWRLIELGLIAG